MRSLRVAARNSLEAQRRFEEAKDLTDTEALEILAEWPTETLKGFYLDDRLTLEEFEAVLHQKFLT